MNDLGALLPIVLIIVVFFFLVLRPARKRQQEVAATQSRVHVGAEVMLTSGIYGTVTAVEDSDLRIELAPGTVVKVARQAVLRVVEAADVPAPTEPGADPLDPSGASDEDLTGRRPAEED